jgi:putative spermidine/putrescine transport system permease protein
LVLAPVVVPLIVTAIAVFDIFHRANLTRSFHGIALAHLILVLPYSVVILESALRNHDLATEEVAMSLGASRWTAFRKVTMPMIAPAIQASFIFAFLISWDEVVMVLFIGGVRYQTLPLRMFEFLETQIRPTIAAVSSLIIYGIFAVAVTLWYQDRRRRKRQTIPIPAKETVKQ